jgi:hypothetical protein
MSTKSYKGNYDIKLEAKVKTKLFPEVSVQGETGKVFLNSKGTISIEATGANRGSLVSAKIAGIFSARVATGLWLPFLTVDSEFENGVRLPIEITLMVYPDKVEIDADKFQRIAKVLLDVDPDVSPFMMRALELQSDRNELAALNALLGLDLQLARMVPEFWGLGARRNLLEFLKVLSTNSASRLRNLCSLRDVLAHGDWTSKKLGDRLNDLLQGGREMWLHEGRISTQATRRVIEETVTALGDLIQCKSRLKVLHQKIAEFGTQPTVLDSKKEPIQT